MSKKFLLAALLSATSTLAATYEVQESDYGHKIVNLVGFELHDKTNINGKPYNGKPYKEAYVVYTESAGGTEHRAACGYTVPFCDKLETKPNAFSLYAGKKAKIKTSERFLDNNTNEEVIMGIQILK